MPEQLPTIVITTILGTVMFLTLSISIIYFLIIYNKKQIKYIEERTQLVAKFNEEILTSKNEVQENTMKHIARELHDNVGQLLSLVKIQLNNIEAEHPDIVKIGDSKGFLNKALTDLRALSKTLNSDNILDTGLSAAISFELQQIEKTGIIQTDLQLSENFEEPNAGLGIVIFRIFQELCQNILKHADAKNLKVNLAESLEGLSLAVIDDGIGFDLVAKTAQVGFESGSGLKNLMNRAKSIGGVLVIKSVVGRGTEVNLTIPKITTKTHDHSSTG